MFNRIPYLIFAVVGTQLFTIITGELQLYVRLSAGLPHLPPDSNHIREITVHLHRLERHLLDGGAQLIIADDDQFSQVRGRWTLNDSVRDLPENRTGSGRVFTGISFPQTDLRSRAIMPTCGVSSSKYLHQCNCCCLGFYTRVEWSNGSLVDTGGNSGVNCLAIRPQWMSELLDENPAFGLLPLTEIAIPGSHNAGSFKPFQTGDTLKELYRDCQEEDTYSQLVYGSRYLDLRPGVSVGTILEGTAAEFWIFHWLLQTNNRIRDVLMDVKRFLEENPREIILIDFHEFPFLFDYFEELAQLVEDTLGSHIYRGKHPSNTTLSQLIRLNTRAVVSFAEDDELARRYIPGVQHAWANTDDLDHLRNSLERLQKLEKIRRISNESVHLSSNVTSTMYSAMAQLTPQSWRIAVDSYNGGVRSLSHQTNLQISSWWLQNSSGDGSSMRDFSNIISVDYLMSTDIIDACIEINRERANTKLRT